MAPLSAPNTVKDSQRPGEERESIPSIRPQRGVSHLPGQRLEALLTCPGTQLRDKSRLKP